MDDLILVKNIQEGKNESHCLNKLYEYHSKIFYKMINSFISDSNASLKEELFKECKYHIYFAAKEFDFSKKTKFSTYLANRTKWMCLNINHKNKRTLNVIDYSAQEEHLRVKGNRAEHFAQNEIDDLLDKEVFNKVILMAKENKDRRIGKIFQLRYVDGNKNKVMPWKSISSKLKMSIQGCINIHNNFINKVKERKGLNG
jgi:DNA-directed RNA polymerase specialized sigma24 family protein